MSHHSTPFTLNDVLSYFGQRELDKAKPYLRSAISALDVDTEHISAMVQGTARRPYHVDIDVYPHTHGVHFVSYCTCPVEQGCKHAAAVLLTILAQSQQPKRTEVQASVREWVEQLRQSLEAKPKAPSEGLVYQLEPPTSPNDHVGVRVFKARVARNGEVNINTLKPWSNLEAALNKTPSFVRQDDVPILHLLHGMEVWSGFYALRGRTGELALGLMLASERLYLEDKSKPLRAGEARRAVLAWQRDKHGLAPTIELEGGGQGMLLDGLWYVQLHDGEVGRALIEQEPRLLERLFEMPTLSEMDISMVSNVLNEVAPTLPKIQADPVLDIHASPQPVITLATLSVGFIFMLRGYIGPVDNLDVAQVSFDYDAIRVNAHDREEYFKAADGRLVRVHRQTNAEIAWLAQLAEFGLAALPKGHAVLRENMQSHKTSELPGCFILDSETCWAGFIQQGIPALRAKGWQVLIPAGFRHHWLEAEEWDAEVSENALGWFDLDMGVLVDGHRLALTPLLRDLFRREPRWLDAAYLDQVSDMDGVMLQTPAGERLRVPAARIKPIVRLLIDLFDRGGSDSLRLSGMDAPRLAALGKDWSLRGADTALALAQRIEAGGALCAIDAPEGLGLTLRPYQLDGLSWLSYLREHGLAGILADDMGLGKTAQTLAFLLREKQQGRLDVPALVVLPTSLIFNWRREAGHIAADLRLLVLHGAARKELFEQIAQSDLVLTTYPLLWRDVDALEQFDWSHLILDEAQTVKNVASQAAQAVRRIKARHRLCLTGTPMENHLGELWAQFDFLLPGFLGDSASFARAFRTPIEKHGDALRRDLLARRLRPFILRRRKEDVAKELPPKNIMVRTVRLEGGQRDQYETVRAAMDEKVLQAIATKGFARSHIVILDALLKLRQVCCDPRLLPKDAAKKPSKDQRKTESAKLELLMDMLPELVDEGRRILVFSQFTSMLALIALALDKAKLEYVTLTGETRDREAVVGRFQAAEVPIFLISLKAGGVGLNLTTADTVIHYDPWWNPAAEDQATDRAHRIGQTRTVFVYKLVAEGSIEERILALQEKKAHLASGVLDADASALSKFGEDDLRALLAPLPDEEG